ncbi:hypothetical protein BOX15_Mlig001038g6, partial [Macrostomum lignano]
APITCLICQGGLNGDSICSAMPACGHVFHRTCLAAWLSCRARPAICPACRTPAPSPPLRLYFSAAGDDEQSDGGEDETAERSAREQRDRRASEQLTRALGALRTEEAGRRLLERQLASTRRRLAQAEADLALADQRAEAKVAGRIRELESLLEVLQPAATTAATAAISDESHAVGSVQQAQQEQLGRLAKELVVRTLSYTSAPPHQSGRRLAQQQQRSRLAIHRDRRFGSRGRGESADEH